MLQGTLTYSAEMSGIQFDGIEIHPSLAGVAKVQLGNPDGKKLEICVTFSSVASQDEARAIAARLLEPILDRLAFQQGARVGFPSLLTEAFTVIPCGDSPDRTHLLCDHINFTEKVLTLRILHANEVARVKADLEQPTPAGERHYGAFRQALNAADPVDQYMSLYRVLADLCRGPKGEESQKAVDEFIAREFKEPLVAPPHRPNAPETVYSRLRNEVGHVRPGVVSQNTREEIRRHLSGLVKIVKRAIELS